MKLVRRALGLTVVCYMCACWCDVGVCVCRIRKNRHHLTPFDSSMISAYYPSPTGGPCYLPLWQAAMGRANSGQWPA